MLKNSVFIGLLFIFLAVFGKAADFKPGFAGELITDALEQPTSIAVAPDGRIFVSEKGGTIRIIEQGTLLSTPFLNLAVDTYGERGLSTILLDQNFDINGYIYAYYNVQDENQNRLSRFTANGNTAIPGSELIMLELGTLASTIHNGGGMRWSLDSTLILATGEGASPSKSQSMTSLQGKILRLNKDGSIPTDNPFYNSASGDYRAIYALGCRNPFTIDIDPLSGRIFFNDVGLSNWEEVNEVLPGKNYGWPTIEGYLTTQTPPANYMDPLFAYPHSQGCAIVGAAAYNYPNSNYPPEIQNHYFFSEFCKGVISMIDLQTNTVTDTFASGLERVTDMVVDPNTGNLMFCEIYTGKLWRVQYIGTGAPFISEHPKNQLVPTGEDVKFNCEAVASGTVNYQWLRNGMPLPGENTSDLTIINPALGDSGDIVQCMVFNSLDTVFSDSAILGVTSNQRPIISINNPIAGQKYKAGTQVRFSGTAIDPESGPILPSSKYWAVDLHHDEHIHPFLPQTYGIDSGTFVVPVIGETDTNVWFRIHHVGVDANGMEGQSYVDVFPLIGNFTLQTQPAGLELIQEGTPFQAPATFYGVPGMERVVIPPQFNIRNDSLFEFSKWNVSASDTLLVTIPENSQTFIAHYEHVGQYVIGKGDGLLGEYFANGTLAGQPIHAQVDPVIDFNFGWGGATHIPFAVTTTMGGDSFAVRWSGDLLAPATGFYTFRYEFDDRVKMVLDDITVVDRFENFHVGEDSLTIFLVSGVRYPLTIEFAELQFQSKMILKWDPPWFGESIVPQQQLYSVSTRQGFDFTPFENAFVFPNPFRDLLQIYVPGLSDPDLQEIRAEVFDQMGRKVKDDVLNINTTHPGQLDVSELSSGQVFLVKISYGSEEIVRRVVKF